MRRIFLLLFTVAFLAASAFTQPTEFTYQGRLTDGVLPANGTYQMQFSLFGSASGGDQIGSTITVSSVTVVQGVFTVTLNIDDPDAFNGDPRWLAIAVKRSADPDYTPLNPRQPLTSTPYAIRSSNASTADLAEDSTKLGGRDASEFVVTSLGPSPPQSGNFNVSGTGTLGSLSVGSGSAGAPAVTFSGDNDTGIFRSAADTLDFSTAGVSRIQIAPDGRIGIGMAPTGASRLSVFEPGGAPGTGTGGSFTGGSAGVSGFGNGSTSTASSFGVIGTAGGSAGVRFGVAGFTNSEAGVALAIGTMGASHGPATFNYGVFGAASGGTTNWAGYFEGNTFTGGPGIIRARINSDVNAGVGLTLNDQPGWSLATVTGGQFQIFNDFLGQNAVWIQRADNNVGIGTTSPGARLDVLGIINTSSQYNIGGNRILSNPGSLNLFAGVNAGFSNGGGAANTFVGDAAGRLNVNGNGNSYFGRLAGENSTGGGNSFFGAVAGHFATGANNAYFGLGSGQASAANPNAGNENAFFGYQSGLVNTSGNLNAFFGAGSGRANTVGIHNAFFGGTSGIANVAGSGNAFFGFGAGDSTVNGHSNSFLGNKAGDANTSGSVNVFLGIAAGQSNTTGHYNTIIGGAANVNVSDLQFASAFGAQSRVGTSDTIVLGKTAGTYDDVPRPADTIQIPGNLTVAGTISGNGSALTNVTASVNTTVVSLAVSIPAASTASGTVNCPVTHPNVSGGGFEFGTFADFLIVQQSRPLAGGNGWLVGAKNTGSTFPAGVTVWAICAK